MFAWSAHGPLGFRLWVDRAAPRRGWTLTGRAETAWTVKPEPSQQFDSAPFTSFPDPAYIPPNCPL